MTKLQKVALTLLACAISLGASAVSRADESENVNVPTENRWAIFIDASNDSTPENAEALAKFRDAVIKIGISEENALVYSGSSNDSQKKPTRENIDKLVEALSYPNDKILPEGKLRKSGSKAGETMIFLTGLGVANDKTGEAYFAPSGVDESEVQGWSDPKLISLKTLEDALLYPKDGQKPLERTFFVVALNSPKAATRGASDDSKRLNGVDLKRLPTRGTTDEDDADEVAKYAHFRVVTKNAKFDDRLIGGFYNALRDGLEGSADVAGNQDGKVSADELANYLESTSNGAGRTVVVDRTGNDPYPICKAQRKLSINEDIFDDLAKAFTLDEYKSEREEAKRKGDDFKKAKSLKARENESSEDAEKENEKENESAEDAKEGVAVK